MKKVLVAICGIMYFGCSKSNSPSPLSYTKKMAGNHYWSGTFEKKGTLPTSYDSLFSQEDTFEIVVLNDSTIIDKASGPHAIYWDTLKYVGCDKTFNSISFLRFPFYTYVYDSIIYYYLKDSLTYHHYYSQSGLTADLKLHSP